MKKLVSRMVLVATVAGGGVFAISAPAFATTVSCQISTYSCQTATIPANASSHQIKVTAFGGWTSPTTCYLDSAASGEPVGWVKAQESTAWSHTFSQLTGRFYATCFGGLDDWAPGGGAITNGG